MHYCTHWITKVNTFIKFNKIRQIDVDVKDTPASLYSYLEVYLCQIPEFSDGLLQKKGDGIFFKQDNF